MKIRKKYLQTQRTSGLRAVTPAGVYSSTLSDEPLVEFRTTADMDLTIRMGQRCLQQWSSTHLGLS